MAQRDSLDKIVGIYIAGVCREEFEFRGQRFRPRPLRVSPLLFRGYTCPASCGGCCPKFSLDYLPTEKIPLGTSPRKENFNNTSIEIRSDFQSGNQGHFCKYLDFQTGRCQNYETRPFSCDFELIRFIVPKEGPIHLTQKLFGRGWAMKRVDGGRGSLCQMTNSSASSKMEVARKLARLQQWAEHFSIETCLETVLEWVEAGPHDEPLFVGLDRR
jgi:hypothetical protein